MPKILVDQSVFRLESFQNEEELEKFVVEKYNIIFGDNNVYFDIKRKVQSKEGKLGSIPDGYLISFFDKSPRLFIIENEISTHDELEVGQQIMKFQATFSEGQIKTKNILMEEIRSNVSIGSKLDKLIEGSRFSNSSELLDEIIFGRPVGFIVIIDEASERLREILRTLNMPPEIIEILKYSYNGKLVYSISDFQFAQVREEISKQIKSISDVDTIVCPAWPENIEPVFLNQKNWYAIRISPTIIPQIKYIALYETAPVSAIRYIGVVKDIVPYRDTGKYQVIVTEIIKLGKSLVLTEEDRRRGGVAPQGPRYTKKELIDKATQLSDIF